MPLAKRRGRGRRLIAVAALVANHTASFPRLLLRRRRAEKAALWLEKFESLF